MSKGYIEKSTTIVIEREDVSHARQNEETPKSGIRGYEARTDEEKALDKSLNLKLDSIVVVICAVNFLVWSLRYENLVKY